MIYKHFSRKEDIWTPLSEERMAEFTVRDEKVVMTRKLLSIRQFRDEHARDPAIRHFLTGLTEMFTSVLAGMMEKEPSFDHPIIIAMGTPGNSSEMSCRMFLFL